MKPSLLSLILLPTVMTAVGCKTNELGRGKATLSDSTRQQALEILREGVKAGGDANFWPAMHAAEGLTLAGYGDETRQAIEPRLATDQDAQHRCGIARELVRAGDKSKLSILTGVLTSPDAYGHVHAAESLFKVYEVGDPKAMRAHYEQTANIKLRLMAAAALARQGDLDAIATIRETLRGSDPNGIQISAWILGQIGSAQDVEPLRARIQDAPSPIIRAYIEHALAMLGDPDGLVALSRNLDSDDAAVRTYAANFAGEAGAAFTQPKLEKMLADPNADARIRAAQSLLFLAK
ncbi:MAG: HEAT repeat domain-containing protein [Verrucomicrobiales bacterium]|nr:HEAT repeat domain-containing protein [Verrucomicrobiales bacterium]